MLFYHAPNHREPQTTGRIFGREKGLKDLSYDSWVDSPTCITNAETDIGSSWQRFGRAQHGILHQTRLKHYSPTLRHCLAGIHHEMDDDLLQARRICQHSYVLGGSHRMQLNAYRDHPPQSPLEL